MKNSFWKEVKKNGFQETREWKNCCKNVVLDVGQVEKPVPPSYKLYENDAVATLGLDIRR